MKHNEDARARLRNEARIGLGERIRTVRMARGMSQRQLGDLVGVHQTDVSAWESGARQPRYVQLVELARALRVLVAQLAGEFPLVLPEVEE